MKKIFVILFTLFILGSCFFNNKQIENSEQKDVTEQDLENVLETPAEEDTKTGELNQDGISETNSGSYLEDKTQTEQDSGNTGYNSQEFINYDKILFGGTYLSFPKSISFGEAKIADDIITYTNFPNLSIKKQDISSTSFNCSNLTDALIANSEKNFYRNTCRDIIKEEGISFYLVKVVGEIYSYEKHFIDYKHGLYLVYVLKTGDYNGLNKTDMENKNIELKQLNGTFENENIIDILVKEIVR